MAPDFDHLMQIQKLEAAMDECIDQEQALLYPPPPPQGDAEADVLLAQAITHAHRELAASDARLKVVSLPLRDGDRVVGAISIECPPTSGTRQVTRQRSAPSADSAR